MKIYSPIKISDPTFQYEIKSLDNIISDEVFIYISEAHNLNIDLDYFIRKSSVNSQALLYDPTKTDDTYFLDEKFHLIETENGLTASGIYKLASNNTNLDDALGFPVQRRSESTFNRKCIFLDRDGILIEDTGYPYKTQDIKFIDSIIPTLKNAIQRGFDLVITTNQSGIAREIFNTNQFKECMAFIENYFSNHDISFKDTYHSPFHKEGTNPLFTKDSLMRKPQCGMHIRACEDHHLDISKCIMVGDRSSDRIYHPLLKSIIIKGTDYLELDEAINKSS